MDITSHILDTVLDDLLDETGGTYEINRAMGIGDFAYVVRAATRALERIHSIPMRLEAKKSVQESDRLRKQGNVHYANKEHKEAIICYNKALAFAPKNSLELQLAYGNISAVMLSIKAYKACQLNIKACLDADCPKFLRDKLTKRLGETNKHINAEMVRYLRVRTNSSLQQYLEFDVKRNAEIPCASEDVDVQNNGDSKKVVAARDIKSCTIVAMERAFVSAQDDENKYTSCYYCHRICLFFLPCEGCCQALFCKEECRNKCMEEYHRIECQIVDYLGSTYVKAVYKLMTRAAIKMSLKLSWEELSVASLEMGEKRLKKSTASEVFDASNPLSILNYEDRSVAYNRDKLEIFKKLFNGSLICAAIIHSLRRVPGYFPEEPEALNKAVDAMSRIMLSLCTKFTNRIEIVCSAFDYQKGEVLNAVQTNVGWFSLTSKLAHSCEPNLYVLGLNDHVALIATQHIKKGEELTICYIDHFYYTRVRKDIPGNLLSRQKTILNAIQYLCRCRACVLEWDCTSQVEAVLTKRQSKAFNKIQPQNFNSDDFLKEISFALDNFTGMINTMQHKLVFTSLKAITCICQYIKTTNESYAAEEK